LGLATSGSSAVVSFGQAACESPNEGNRPAFLAPGRTYRDA
jgi:hypothetical protein